MAKITALLLFSLLFAARCSEAPKELPTIPEEKMAAMMADMNVADAATNGLTGYSKDSLMHVYFAQVFEIHRISREEYEKNMKLYGKDFDAMDRILKKSAEILGEKPQNQ